MRNHRGSKLLLIAAALLLVAGMVRVEDALAASATKACKKECKTQKKTCTKVFADQYKVDKAVCKAAKGEGNAACKATKDADLGACGSDKQCKKDVKKAFKECKKAVKTNDKACKKNAKAEKKRTTAACNTGGKACNFCCKTQTDCNIGNCGDGVQVPGEGCDDANAVSGDGCSSSCQIEGGYTCTGSPSVCVLRCGNGVIDPGEECDSSSETCPGDYLCIPSGELDECTCAEPCRLDPVPTKLRFTSEPVTGNCGCTLTSPDDTSCDGASKLGDLECGQLYIGGGLSAVPPGPAPDGATNYVEFPACRGTKLIAGPSAGTEPTSPRDHASTALHCRSRTKTRA